MDFKKIILVLGIICIMFIGAIYLYTSDETNNKSTLTNNTTNITNNTVDDSDNGSVSSSESYASNNELESSSKSYVEKWDESQQSDGDWAYTHDQPVKTGDDGKEYKRVYDEDSGKSSWQSMDSSDYEY